MTRLHRLVAASVLGMSLGALTVPAANAAMVSAEATLTTVASAERLNSALDAADVRAALVRHGVAPEVARARINALSADELSSLAARYEQLPAGGAVAEVLIIGFLVWAVLVATDYGGVFMGDDEKKTATQ